MIEWRVARRRIREDAYWSGTVDGREVARIVRMIGPLPWIVLMQVGARRVRHFAKMLEAEEAAEEMLRTVGRHRG